MKLEEINAYIKEFDERLGDPCLDFDRDNFYVGVDLGTANIVISVVDSKGKPLGGALYPSSVVKDGVVVDFVEATRIVKKLKKKVEDSLGIEIKRGATAIPPGVEEGSTKAIVNVIEAAEIDVVKVVDEPTAASKVLKITDGAVVDVGGGTTGISILKAGKVIFTADEPTGGTHMSLVVAGNYGVGFEEGEEIKKNKAREDEMFLIVKPVVEKMATIVEKFIEGYGVEDIYVVGGACTFNEFQEVFEKILKKKIIKPYNPLLVTPLGISLSNII